MAKSGFVPAWMKISSNHQLQNETNSTIIKGRQRHHSSDIDNHTTTRHTLFYYSKSSEKIVYGVFAYLGRCRNKSNDQQSSNDGDGQSENVFSFPSRRSYSRERLANSFGKGKELNSNDYYNRPSINSNTNLQHRLHFLSSSSYNNGHSLERLSNDDHSDMIIKSNENTLDQREKDFPSLNGRGLASNANEKSSIWNNAASKFRLSNKEISSFKYFDRSLSTNNGNLSRTFGSNRLLTRKDRLLSTPNNLNINTRPIIPELQTNCITQTKNLDKRSDFLNSLKNEEKPENSQTSKSKLKTPKGILLLLSVPETSEEKELLIRMGWNDDTTYEITDKDKEEYEKRIKLLPKTDKRTAELMSALNRRALPCINIRDILQLEMIDSSSDDESSND